MNHWLDDHIIGTVVKLVYCKQNDINGLLTCAHTHAQESSLLPVVESTKPHPSTQASFFLFFTQVGS